jgi:hypothetical protein
VGDWVMWCNWTAIEGFISWGKAHWAVRTTCHPGYVIWKCREFRGEKPLSDEPVSFFEL